MRIAGYNYSELENFIYTVSLADSLSPEESQSFNKLLSSLEERGIKAICLKADEINNQEVKAEDSFAVKYQKLKGKSLILLDRDWQMTELEAKGFYCLGYNTEVGSRVILGLQEIDTEFVLRTYQRLSGQPWIVLETEECILREMSLEDLDQLYMLYQNPSIIKWVEALYEDRNKEVEFQSAYINSMYDLYELGLWLVFDKENDQLIGRAGIEFRDYNGEQVIELGYMLADTYQGQGIATQVCQGIIDYVKRTTDYQELYCFIENDNKPSLCLAERLGFQKVGTCPTEYKSKNLELGAYRIILNNEGL